LRFLVDAQLPPALARRIESLGHAAEHVADRGLAKAPDNQIRACAGETGAVIVTNDEDFAVHRVLHEGPRSRHWTEGKRSSNSYNQQIGAGTTTKRVKNWADKG
jgi:predicted nuclease of predicted toxin-antitoxin system